MYISRYFLCKIYWCFALTHYAPRSKGDERKLLLFFFFVVFFFNQVWTSSLILWGKMWQIQVKYFKPHTGYVFLILHKFHADGGDWPRCCKTINGYVLPWCGVIIDTLRPRQKGRHFADDIFKCIFVNENVWISIGISLNFFPRGPINNIPALVQIMARRRSGDKQLR